MKNKRILCVQRDELRFISKTRVRRYLDLAEQFELVILIPNGAVVAEEVAEKALKIIRIPVFESPLIIYKLASIILFLYHTLSCLKRDPAIDIVYTGPNYVIIFGYVAKVFFRKKWVVDLYDNLVSAVEMRGVKGLIYSTGFFILKRMTGRADLAVVAFVPEYSGWVKAKNIMYTTNGVDVGTYENLRGESGGGGRKNKDRIR